MVAYASLINKNNDVQLGTVLALKVKYKVAIIICGKDDRKHETQTDMSIYSVLE